MYEYNVHTSWTFAQFVRPLLATILCVWEIWSGSNSRVCVSHISLVGNTTDFESDLHCTVQYVDTWHCTCTCTRVCVYDQKPETLFWPKFIFPSKRRSDKIIFFPSDLTLVWDYKTMSTAIILKTYYHYLHTYMYVCTCTCTRTCTRTRVPITQRLKLVLNTIYPVDPRGYYMAGNFIRG